MIRLYINLSADCFWNGTAYLVKYKDMSSCKDLAITDSLGAFFSPNFYTC